MNLADRKRIDLLDTYQRDVRARLSLFTRHEIHEHLAAAQHESPHVARPLSRIFVVDERSKTSFGKVAWRGRREWVTEKTFWRQYDERQRVGFEQERLPSQQVKVLSGRRAVGHAHVGIRGDLQEPLDAGARMIRSLSFVAVGQEQHEGWGETPFRAARHDELIQDHLRAVDEVAILRFPHDKPFRLLD